MTYAEKLKDPRWQKRRLELLSAANWKCKGCSTKTETLHVHHGFYQKNTEPWDYPDSSMHVLCETCHAEAQRHLKMAHEAISRFSNWDLAMLNEVLSALSEEHVYRGMMLDQFNYVINAALTIGLRPTTDQSDFDWMVNATVAAVKQNAEYRGHRQGTAQAEARAKGQPVQ